MKKLLSFFGLCAYALGAIGGVGYTLYNKAYVIAVAVVVLAVMAFPKVKDCYKELTA